MSQSVAKLQNGQRNREYKSNVNVLSQEGPNPDEDTFSSLPAQNQNFGIRIGKKRPMTTKHLSGAAVISQKKMQLLSYGAGSNK